MTSDSDSKKLFVAGLPESITERRLRDWFQESGLKIARVGIPLDRATGRPRGFAFVTLETEGDAVKARQNLDGSLLDGRDVSVREFRSEPQRRGPPPRPGPPGRPPGGVGAVDRPPQSPRPAGGGPPPRPGGFNREHGEQPLRTGSTAPQSRATWDEPRRTGTAKKDKKEKRKKAKGLADRMHLRRESEVFNFRSRRVLDDFDDESEE